MSQAYKTLDDGARAFIEGVGAIQILEVDDETYRARLRDTRACWYQLKNTPVDRCKRELHLVEKDGRLAWRAALWVEVSSTVSVFTGRSTPVSVEDLQKREGVLWLQYTRYPVDFGPDAQEYWQERIQNEFPRLAPIED